MVLGPLYAVHLERAGSLEAVHCHPGGVRGMYLLVCTRGMFMKVARAASGPVPCVALAAVVLLCRHHAYQSSASPQLGHLIWPLHKIACLQCCLTFMRAHACVSPVSLSYKCTQVGLLQAGCTLYEYSILRACNVQRLRMFGVLLALPSATIRVMSSRPCQVITAAWLRLVFTC